MSTLQSNQRAKPFLRWAGSKRLLVSPLESLTPSEYGTYFEPFLGGGSLFLRLSPQRAILGDALGPLATLWNIVRNEPDALIKRIEQWPTTKHFYDEIKLKSFVDDLDVAAQFLYLNRSAYGGIYRLNSRGNFNVPWSASKSANPLDTSNLLRVSALLRSSTTNIHSGDYSDLTVQARKGDLVFLDPPYSHADAHRPFIHYNQSLFGWADQTALALEAERLRILGAHVIVTNTTHPDIEKLYPNFSKVDLSRQSSLAVRSTTSGRLHERAFLAL